MESQVKDESYVSNKVRVDVLQTVLVHFDVIGDCALGRKRYDLVFPQKFVRRWIFQPK